MEYCLQTLEDEFEDFKQSLDEYFGKTLSSKTAVKIRAMIKTATEEAIALVHTSYSDSVERNKEKYFELEKEQAFKNNSHSKEVEVLKTKIELQEKSLDLVVHKVEGLLKAKE